MPRAVIRFFSATGHSKLAAPLTRQGLEQAGWQVQVDDLHRLRTDRYPKTRPGRAGGDK